MGLVEARELLFAFRQQTRAASLRWIDIQVASKELAEERRERLGCVTDPLFVEAGLAEQAMAVAHIFVALGLVSHQETAAKLLALREAITVVTDDALGEDTEIEP